MYSNNKSFQFLYSIDYQMAYFTFSIINDLISALMVMYVYHAV